MATTRNQLIIATYNIELSINVEKVVNNIALMAKNGVDIFCLQEIVNMPTKELIIATILRKLGPDWQAASHIEGKTTKVNIGSSLLWNTKILQFKKAQKIDLPKLKHIAFHEIIFSFLVGAAPYPLQRRAITCTFAFQKEKIQITSLHLDHIGGKKHRIQQLQYLLKQLPKVPYEIICGDFNTFDLLQTGKEQLLLQKILTNEFTDAATHVGYTADMYNMSLHNALPFTKWFIKLLHIHIKRKLDYIWVKNMRVRSCYKLKLAGSDHFPLIAKLSI